MLAGNKDKKRVTRAGGGAVAGAGNAGKERLTHEAFVNKAITALRKEGYKGLHTVYSGFNKGFRLYYPQDNPIEITQTLAKGDKIDMHACKGGAMLYLKGEMPAGKQDDGSSTLEKMGV